MYKPGWGAIRSFGKKIFSDHGSETRVQEFVKIGTGISGFAVKGKKIASQDRRFGQAWMAGKLLTVKLNTPDRRSTFHVEGGRHCLIVIFPQVIKFEIFHRIKWQEISAAKHQVLPVLSLS